MAYGNVIKNNPTNGVLAFEYPNPFPPQEDTIYFQLSGNAIVGNRFSGNGYNAANLLDPQFAGDVMLEGGLFGEMKSTNNCLWANRFTAPTYPEKIEGTWGCQNYTTPNPDATEASGLEKLEYLLTLQAESEGRTAVAQPAPPAQPTMPNPCGGVPNNPLCPKGW